MGRGFVKIGGAETDPEDMRLCEEAWQWAVEQMHSGKYDLMVLDEINYVISYKMLDAGQSVAGIRAAAGATARDLHRTQRPSETGGAGGPGDGDARSEASLYQGNSGAARNRLLIVMWLDRKIWSGLSEKKGDRKASASGRAARSHGGSVDEVRIVPDDRLEERSGSESARLPEVPAPFSAGRNGAAGVAAGRAAGWNTTRRWLPPTL